MSESAAEPKTDPRSRYGLSRARAHGRPGRETRPASRTVDAHGHAWVDATAEFVRPHLTGTTSLLRDVTPDTQVLNRRQGEERRPNLTDARLRLADMDAMGLDAQVVLPSPSQSHYDLSPDIAVRAARMTNDGIAELVSHAPDRLVPFGTLPLQDTAASVEELERIVRQLGFKGVQVITNLNGTELSDPVLAPFWAKAEALGAAVLMHPLGFTEPRRLSRYYFNNVIGQPFDTTLALHHLIFGGVLERHPALKLIAVHGGGYLGAYSGRIDHAWGARSDAEAGLPRAPSTYLRQVYVDSVVFTPHQLAALLPVFGPDKILLGTDYPYDMAEYDPLGHLASVEGLAPETLAKIAGGNAERLFGLR